MAVTESSLLTSFLLPPAPLTVSLSLQQFTELFPKSRREDASIPGLYRELQKQRTQDIERVKQNIVSEAQLGESQQRHVRRMRSARLQQDLGTDMEELAMEAQLFPKSADSHQRKPHNMETLLSEMQHACQDMEEELGEMEEEAQLILTEVRATVGDLSDLRYGRFSKTPGTDDSDVALEVVESLKRIQQLSSGGKVG